MSCKLCVMDSTDSLMQLDSEGVCNYCLDDARLVKKLDKTDPDGARKQWLETVRVMRQSEGGEFACILGVSGGLDSSYAVYQAHKSGLNGLMVHVDNGFDSKQCKENLKCLREGSGFEFRNVAPDGDEFRALMHSYFRSGVKDCDIPSDEAIVAAVQHAAAENGVRFIVSGGNYQTEAFMTSDWCYRNKNDLWNMRDIYSKNRVERLRINTFPKIGFFGLLWNRRVRHIRSVYPHNLLGYVKRDALATLNRNWGYVDYGDKHCENILTRWLERFFFPIRWGFDKRLMYLSCLVRSGQMSRGEVVEKLAREPLYPLPVTGDSLEDDTGAVCRGLGLSKRLIKDYLEVPKREHLDYASDQSLYDGWSWVLRNRFARSMWRKVSGED